jgi:hypothetical protein
MLNHSVMLCPVLGIKLDLHEKKQESRDQDDDGDLVKV